MLLAIKIGNSNIGFGVFEGARLVHTWRVQTRAEKTADEYASQLLDFFESGGDARIRIADVAIGSVVPELTTTFEDLARRYLSCAPFVVAPGVRSGIRLRYEDPRALGADRLIAMVAAKARYGAPAVVLDLGTATTCNVLDAAGNFVGGAIAPGLNIEAESLHQFTAKLPLVEIAPPPRALATNTRDALRSGIFFGYAGLIEGLIARLRADLGLPDTRVIATGGLAALVAPHCPSIDIVDSQLAFEGLRLLFEMNIEKR
jgi:type III pantothenate kinase